MEHDNNGSNVDDFKIFSHNVDTSLHNILKLNFDVVSRPAIVTVAKYLYNIIQNPHDLKFRKVNTVNKIFVTKITPAKGYEGIDLSYENFVYLTCSELI